MRPIRVLIVDDSAVICRIVSSVLESDPQIEVVGSAANGRIALDKVRVLRPDVMTLDVEMPEMDGLQTLAILRRIYPQLHVIMCSTHTNRGAEATIEALILGAVDYVTKPSSVGSLAVAMQRIREQLIPKIKKILPPKNDNVAFVRRAKIPQDFRRIGVIAIGCSVGGPKALIKILAALPQNLPVPIVIVQHMLPLFVEHLASALNAKSPLHVEVANEDTTLLPGYAYIAPGEHHMAVVKQGANVKIQLSNDPPENSCRPAADFLFRSVAKVYHQATLGVVLTGMGQDGLNGCQHINDAGGQIIVQDKETSVVWGMPGAVAQANLAHYILPIDKISEKIIQKVSKNRSSFFT